MKAINNNELISYEDEKINIKTVYTIEYIDNKKDFDKIETHPAAWELYKTIKTESLHDAIKNYILLFSRQYSAEGENLHVYDVKLSETILLNNEVIREKFISDISGFTNIIDQHAGIIERNNMSLKNDIKTVNNELNNAYNFLELYRAKDRFDDYKKELKTTA